MQRMSASDVSTRATHARAFLAAAELIDSLGEDAGIESRTNMLGALAVLAGIAASDAICGRALGERAAGENHADAVVVLKRATPPGDSAPAQLKRLLDAKTTTQYSPMLLGESKSSELLSTARRLVDGMEAKLRS
jgi:hypothetical protein